MKKFIIGPMVFFAICVLGKEKAFAQAPIWADNHDTSFPSGTQKGVVLFVDADGCLEPGCAQKDKIGGFALPAAPLLLYPNPVEGSLHIQFTGKPGGQAGDLWVYNAQGRLMEKIALTPGQSPQTLSTKHWPRGLCYVQLICPTQAYAAKKIMVK